MRKKKRALLLSGGVAILLVATAAFVLWPRKHRFADESCRESYEALFSGPSLEVRMIFGYKDARPARFVGDRYESLLLSSRIESPCRNGEAACGFARDPRDPELFTKKVLGPDGRKKLVRLRVVHSSVGPDDQENRSNPFQKWQSSHAESAFLDGLKDADIVFYDGHSRDGGGPDFAPPRLMGKHVDYGWYQAKKPGFERLLGGLRKGPARVRVLGLFSCSSSEHFSSEIRRADRELGLVSSRYLLYFSDAIDSALDALSGVLKMQCQPELKSVLRARSSRAGTEIQGFFRSPRKTPK